MRAITLVLLAALSINVSAKDICQSYPTDGVHNYPFDLQQESVIKKAYQLGVPSDLGLSLAAIAWQESNAGQFNINWNDPSFGPFHILIKTGATRAGIKGYYRKIELAQQLMFDIELGAAFATQELLYWKGRFKRKGQMRWHNVWAAYNGGNNHKGEDAQNYAKSIRSRIDWLKQCTLNQEERKRLKDNLIMGHEEHYVLGTSVEDNLVKASQLKQ